MENALCKVNKKGGRNLKKIILASHGDLSKGMLNSLNMIIGEAPCPVEAYSLYPGESTSDFAQNLIKKVEADLETEYIIVADILSGSVHTALMQILQTPNVHLYSGMNMSLVMELILSTDSVTDNTQKFLNAGKEGITYMNSQSLVVLEEEDF